MSKNVNREGLTYGEFRAAALAFCTDANDRVALERAVRKAWQAGEDPTDYAHEISKALAKRARAALARLERDSSSDAKPARVDAEGTAQPLTRLVVHLRPGQCYHGAAHAGRDGIYVNGEERIPLR